MKCFQKQKLIWNISLEIALAYRLPKAEQVEKLKLQIAFVLLPENLPMKTIRT